MVGAVFGNGHRTYPDLPRNTCDPVLVTEQYTLRQPVRDVEGSLELPGAHYWAHKEIARLKCIDREAHGIHNFIYVGAASPGT